MTKILVVEDEAHLAQGLRFNLEAEGYLVTLCETGEAALDVLQQGVRPDLIVLDVMLPGLDGFSVVGEIRKTSNFVPVLMLTALHRPEDVLKGFESGADDYLAKPFDLKILLARIRSLLRRNTWMNEQPHPKEVSEAEVFEFDEKTVDFKLLELRTSSGTFKLTLMEIELLRYLIRHQGVPVSRQQILQDVWNLPADMDTRAIDNFIVRLRRYIEPEPARPVHLLTVRGVGYRFVAQSNKSQGAR